MAAQAIPMACGLRHSVTKKVDARGTARGTLVGRLVGR